MAIILGNFFLQVLGVLVALIGVAYAYIKIIAYNYWSSKGVVQAEPVVPFGNLWPVFTVKKSMGELMRDEYLRFRKSRVVGLYLFLEPTLVIRDLDIIRFILTKEFSSFQNRIPYHNKKVDPLSSHLFLLPAEKWRKLRMKFTPTFTSGKMKHMFETVREHADTLTQCLKEETESNAIVQIRSLMARFTTDVIASVAFGIDCKSLKDVNAEFYTWGQKVFEPKPVRNTLQILCPSIMNLLNISATDKGAEYFFIKVFTDVVKYRTDNDVVKNDFLDSVIKLMYKGYVEVDDGQESALESKESMDKITPLEGAAQAFIFWLAGFETSSTTATYCLYELALAQEIQDQVANEVNGVLKKFGGLTYDGIGEMQYLHKVVSETLRKYPSVPILNRECTQETELFDTGLKMSKKASIVIPVLGIHWDPEIYPEPEKFDPERFNEENIASRHRYAYLPFGEGPRNCIGLRFGLLQTKIALATVVSQYRCLPGPDTKVPLPLDRGSFLHAPKGDVALRLEKR